MKFFILTDEDGNELLINSDKIISTEDREDDSTILYMITGSDYYRLYVEENSEQILEKING